MSKRKKGTKKQHVVPQFYLKNFANLNGRLLAYDKVSGKSFPVGVADAAQRAHFLTIPAADEDHGAGWFAETYFGTFETPAAQAIRMILAGVRSGVTCLIADPMRRVLSRYIVAQFMRTPAARARLLDINRALHNLARVVTERLPPGTTRPEGFPLIGPEQEAAFHMSVGLSPDTISNIAEPLFQHVWGIFANATGIPYYTSDHPVTMHSLVLNRRSEPGLGSYGVEICLPISPRHMLSLVDREWITDYQPGLLARDGCIWGSHSPDNVTFYRSLQVRDSYRFVYCPADDFELAREMCETHPDLREPDRPQSTMMWGGEKIYGPPDE